MIRTQIQLSTEQHRQLKEIAHREHLSLASAVRLAVELWLQNHGRAEMAERSIASLGRFRSGKKDVSGRHDDYLADVYHGTDTK